VIAEGFALQRLDLLVVFHVHAECPLHNLVGQQSILQSGSRPAILPFVGQTLPDGDTSHPFINPRLRITLLLVEFLHPAHDQFGVFNFVYALPAHPCQPALERFHFGRWDGLNNPEQGFRIGTVCSIKLTVAGWHFQLSDFFGQLVISLL